MKYPDYTQEQRSTVRRCLPVTRFSDTFASKKAILIWVKTKDGKHTRGFWTAKRFIKVLKDGKYMRIAFPMHFTYKIFKMSGGDLEEVGRPLSSTEMGEKFLYAPKEVEQKAITEECEEAFSDDVLANRHVPLPDGIRGVPIADQRHTEK